MQSEVRVRTGDLRVKVVIGLFATIVIIAAMVLFWNEVRLILLGGSSLIGVLWLAVIRQYVTRRKFDNTERALDLRILAATARKAEAEARKAENEARFLIVSRTQRIIHSPADEVRVIEALPDSVKYLPESAEGGPAVKLLDVAPEFIHIALIGGSNSGKTTVMNHLIDTHPAGTVVYALDPHAKFNTWSSRATVVRSYAAIGETLASVYEDMLERYQGEEMHFRRIVLAMDEWPSIVAHEDCGDAKKHLLALARESRKANIRLILGSQGDSVKDLGIEGHGQTRENFVKVKLSPQLVKQNRGILIDGDGQQQAVELAGPYYGGGGSRFFNRSETYSLPAPKAPEPTDEEQRVIDLHQAGKSHAQICEAVWGYKSSKKYPEIDRIIGKFS